MGVLGQYSDKCAKCGNKFQPGDPVDVVVEAEWSRKHTLSSPQNLTVVHSPWKGCPGGN